MKHCCGLYEYWKRLNEAGGMLSPTKDSKQHSRKMYRRQPLRRIDPGKATILSNQPIVAGAFASIHYTYTAGHPIDDSGYVKIVFRTISDFGEPQFDNPVAANFCSISTSGD